MLFHFYKTIRIMPELPDLQVFSINLQKQLAGKKLESIKLVHKPASNVSQVKLKKALEKQSLKKVFREGKELRMEFSNGHLLGLHFMLHGKFQWFDGKDKPPHVLLELVFEKGKQLAMIDFQRKARIILDPEPSDVPDALSTAANLAFWKKQLQKKTKIKNLLLDQHIVRGIGNAYADEILWKARISPFSASNKIPPAQVRSLATAVKQVLQRAIKQIKKEVPDIIGGEQRDFLQIHNARVKKSPTGAPILTKASGARKTYYTREQKLYT
jgi:formamidopyrimidine-DNA glycosylase